MSSESPISPTRENPNKVIERHLDGLETMLIRIQGMSTGSTRYLVTNGVGVAYSGDLDESALSEAFRLLSIRYPIIRARIREAEDGHLVFQATADVTPSVAILDGEENVLRQEIHKPWDTSRGLVRLLVRRGKGEGSVVFQTSHAAADGHSIFPWLQDLWKIYSDVVAGKNPKVEPAFSLPLPPSALLPIEVGDLDGSVRNNANHKLPKRAIENGRTRVCYLRLTKRETRGLIEAAHTHEETLHTLLSGAIIVTLRNRSNSIESEFVVCKSVVDLRRLVSPPAGPAGVTRFDSYDVVPISLSKNADPITIGKQVKDHLRRSISERNLPLTISEFQRISAEMQRLRPLATAEISNVGKVPKIENPPLLKLTDILPVFPAEDGESKQWGHYVMTFNDCMTIVISSPSTREDPENYATELKGALLKIVSCVEAA